MKDSISPEERLLRLIKGQKKENGAINSGVSLNHATQGHPRITFTILSLYRFLTIAFVFSLVYFAFSLFWPVIGPKKIALPEVAKEDAPEPKIELKQNTRPIEFYLDGLKDSHIFSAQPTTETTKPPPAINSDAVKDINLVGIISGANPQVIIEDKKTQKTYYVNKGQAVGEFIIEEIGTGKVIINYKGERFELYL